MNIEQILDVMDEMLDKSWGLPLSGGRTVVDAEKVRDLIDDIRINLPSEIRQAQAIVADRGEILKSAKLESEEIIRKAEQRSKVLINQEAIVKAAEKRAAEIMTQAAMKSKEIRHAAQEFSDGILKSSEESLARAVSELRSARHALRSSDKK